MPWETRKFEDARFEGVELVVEEVRYGSLVFRAEASWSLVINC